MIRILVDVNTMGDRITVDEWLAFQENDYKTAVNVLSRFVVDENNQPIPEPEARRLVGKLTMSEWQRARDEMRIAAQEAAVPNENGSS